LLWTMVSETRILMDRLEIEFGRES
jgi:hypothetical protein